VSSKHRLVAKHMHRRCRQKYMASGHSVSQRPTERGDRSAVGPVADLDVMEHQTSFARTRHAVTVARHADTTQSPCFAPTVDCFS